MLNGYTVEYLKCWFCSALNFITFYKTDFRETGNDFLRSIRFLEPDIELKNDFRLNRQNTFNILCVSFFAKTISMLLIFLSLQCLKKNLFKGFLSKPE